MPDLTIKPVAAAGNKLILQDQAGGAVLTTTDSGATMSSNVTGIPAAGVTGVLPVGVTGGSGLEKDGWILLQTTTASGAATGFTIGSSSLIDSTYDDYMIRGSQVCFTGDSQLLFQATLAGTNRTDNWKTQSYGYDTSTALRSVTSGGYAHSFISAGANAQGATGYGGTNFTIWLNKPHISSGRHVIWGNCAYRNSSGYIQFNNFSACRETTAGALTAVKIFSSSYAFDGTGTINLYGLSK